MRKLANVFQLRGQGTITIGLIAEIVSQCFIFPGTALVQPGREARCSSSTFQNLVGKIDQRHVRRIAHTRGLDSRGAKSTVHVASSRCTLVKMDDQLSQPAVAPLSPRHWFDVLYRRAANAQRCLRRRG